MKKVKTFVTNHNDVDREKGDAADREGVQGYDFERLLVQHRLVFFHNNSQRSHAIKNIYV